MKYRNRVLEKTLQNYLSFFPAVGITGPRQSGKSTMLKKIFCPEYTYVTFDDPLQIEFLGKDPVGFIEKYNNKIIFDEVQKVPEIFNYLKIQIDNDRQNYGKYILTGSSQFSLVQKITESLAGRIGLLSLLPFQISEVPEKIKRSIILNGSYPELVMRDFKGDKEWYAAYINNYIERDVRSLYNIGNLRDFQRLILILASRVSQELNVSGISRDIGVSVKTVQSWISILEASYIIFLIQPYFNNLGKRIVKRPKLYFYDTGLICYLTGISNIDILEKGPLAGAVFENHVICETKKIILHNNFNRELYYYRSNHGIEADLILVDKEKNCISYIEIKNSKTARYRMIESIKKLVEAEKISPGIINFDVVGKLIYRGKKTEVFTEDIGCQNYLVWLSDNE